MSRLVQWHSGVFPGGPEWPPADRAFEFALELATYFRGELHVLFVYQPLGDETRLQPEVTGTLADPKTNPSKSSRRSGADEGKQQGRMHQCAGRGACLMRCRRGDEHVCSGSSADSDQEKDA